MMIAAVHTWITRVGVKELPERGCRLIHIIEHMHLEDAHAAKLTEFMFILAPLKILGATGSPARPLAVI